MLKISSINTALVCQSPCSVPCTWRFVITLSFGSYPPVCETEYDCLYKRNSDDNLRQFYENFHTTFHHQSQRMTADQIHRNNELFSGCRRAARQQLAVVRKNASVSREETWRYSTSSGVQPHRASYLFAVNVERITYRSLSSANSSKRIPSFARGV